MKDTVQEVVIISKKWNWWSAAMFTFFYKDKVHLKYQLLIIFFAKYVSSHNGTKSKIVFFYFHIFTPLMNKKYQ